MAAVGELGNNHAVRVCGGNEGLSGEVEVEVGLGQAKMVTNEACPKEDSRDLLLN